MPVLNRIKELCEKNHISIARLEKECGLGNATIRGWQRCTPSVITLKKVADYFGCTIDDLLKEDST